MADSGSGSAKDKAFVKVDFDPDPGFDLLFDGLKGHEELGKPFLYELSLTATELVGNISKLIGSKAKVTMKQSDSTSSDSTKYIHGIVTRVVSKGLDRGAYHYQVELRPWLWLLTRVTDCCIFQNKNAFDIITDVFRKLEFSDFEDKRQNSSGSIVLDYCVQYRETTFDFVQRLMEQFGIYYFFTHDETTHKLVFADDSNSHKALTDKIPYQFDTTEHRTVSDHIWEWATDLVLHPGKFTFQDYNFEKPAVDLTSKTVKPATHSHGDYEVYEYPGPYAETDDGQKLTDVRMQAIVAQRVIFNGSSNSRLLHAGWKFTLDKYPDTDLNKEYLITRTETHMSIAEGMSSQDSEGGTIDTYHVVMHAIPGDVPFRLERRTARPLIRGPQTAKVMGPSGDEIYTDQYGRVKVKFFWDRSETADDQRTCWIRVAQTWAGQGWGAVFIPRVGMEVVVEFLEGNPDRPLITGVVYNATMTVPYALPDNKTMTVLKTNSSTGGSGFNELRFEDKAGDEKIWFQAQKDYDKKVLNDEVVTIHKDTTTTVETGKRAVTVSQGDNEMTVSQGKHTMTVQGNHGTTVQSGNHTLDVSAGKSDITAAQSITLTVGGSSIKISPSGIEITAPQVKATGSGTMDLDGGGMMTIKAGMVSIN